MINLKLCENVRFVIDTRTWVGTTWVLFVGPYMYIGWSLSSMLKQVLTEWKDDKHLIK